MSILAGKNLELEVAMALGHNAKVTRMRLNKRIKATRPDIHFPPCERLKFDCKYRQKWSHHKFLQEVDDKYCKAEGDEPILITKHHRQRSINVTIRFEFFRELLEAWLE